MKILVVLFRTLGDVLMGTTVVRAIKQKYPDSVIDFVTEKSNVNTLENNPDINQIIVMDNYFDANVLFVKEKYDKIYRLNMANHDDTCWHHIPKHQNQHLVEWYAKRAGIDKLDDKNVYVYLSDEDNKKVEEVMNELPKESLVAIHTSSGWHSGMKVESKDWPIYYFDVIAERLIKNGYKVVQIGAPNDKPLTTTGVINLLGKFTFKQTAGFLKKCKSFIGVDSGPSYLAGWSGIPSIVIMGATQNQTPENLGPSAGPRNDNVFYLNPERPSNPNCRPVPCFINCPINKQGGCVVDIFPNQVWELFKKTVEE